MRWFRTLSADPRILWGSFAAGFLCPPVFLLFLALGTVRAYRAFKEEYADVGRYWHGRAAGSAEKVALPRQPRLGETPAPCCLRAA
jgi:hypothetical protein